MPRFVLSLVLTLLLAQASAHADPMPARYVPALRSMFVAAQAPGMVAMVVDGERTYVAGFGRTNPDDANAPGERTLVRLNSLSKLMTGEVLASLVDAHVIRLDDRLQQFAPAGGRVPVKPNTPPITIRDLVIHTSGLARDVPVSVWQAASPKAARWDWLSRTAPLRAPGSTAEYSNAAWLLLGDAMERATRESYPALLNRIVLAPLRLADMTLTPSPAQCARLLAAPGVSCEPMTPTAASWGIYATPADVSLWLQALMTAPAGTPVHRSLQDLVTRRELKAMRGLDFAGRADAIGYGWLRMEIAGRAVLQKTGGGAKTMNYLIMSPGNRRALLITVSRMDIDMLRQLTRSANALMANILHDTF
jgi:D-alanyl-D-alanine-carboxypeptidase/D-alanyl-D-alanine-endopeptidase